LSVLPLYLAAAKAAVGVKGALLLNLMDHLFHSEHKRTVLIDKSTGWFEIDRPFVSADIDYVRSSGIVE
jgi:hypothetical protein